VIHNLKGPGLIRFEPMDIDQEGITIDHYPLAFS